MRIIINIVMNTIIKKVFIIYMLLPLIIFTQDCSQGLNTYGPIQV